MANYDDVVVDLKKQGLTYSEISAYIEKTTGTPFTRDMVYGSLKRAGMTRPYNSSRRFKHGTFLEQSDLIAERGLDPAKWRVTNYRTDGLSIKPLQNELNFDEIKERYESFVPKDLVAHTYGDDCSRKMAEVNIADLHLGKLCWHGDTRNDYDLDIARNMFRDLVARTVAKLSVTKPEVIYFVWANDFFNSDNEENTTSRGTPQDVDGRHQKMYNIGCELLIEAVEALRTIAPVKTFYTRSNHDAVTGYHALMHLYAYFGRCEGVEIDKNAYPRQYVEYGANMIGYTHGDKERGGADRAKAAVLASLMPVEEPQMWARTKYREYHAHHLHSEQAWFELNGVIVRRIASPTASDAFHVESGYIGAVRKMQIFIYDYDMGLEEIINIPVRGE